MRNVEMNISSKKMIAYLQMKLDAVKKFEKNYEDVLFGGNVDPRAVKMWTEMVEEMIACKEMVEALIEMPVNLQANGEVTVGFISLKPQF